MNSFRQPIDTTSVTTSVPSSCVSTATFTRFSTKSSGRRQVLAVTPHDPQRQPRLFERRRRILDGVADHVRDIHRDGFLRCCVVRRVVVAARRDRERHCHDRYDYESTHRTVIALRVIVSEKGRTTICAE